MQSRKGWCTKLCFVSAVLVGCTWTALSAFNRRVMGVSSGLQRSTTKASKNVSDLAPSGAVDAYQICHVNGGKLRVSELIYPKQHWRHDTTQDRSGSNNPSWRYSISIHDPTLDTVVSKGLWDWAFSPKHTYASVTEVHTLCTAQVGERPLVQCNDGNVAVEVGAAIGMVSLYLATRGMRVFSVDPVKPNLDRLRESLCLNGVRVCKEKLSLSIATEDNGGMEQRGLHAGREISPSSSCRDPAQWRQYSPERVSVVLGAGAESGNSSRRITAQQGNLAATMQQQFTKGTSGAYASEVPNVGLDPLLLPLQAEIEIVHLACQGDEAAVLRGARQLLERQKIRNVVLSLYFNAQTPEQRRVEEATRWKTLRMLRQHGFELYDIEGCGRGAPQVGATSPPQLLRDEVELTMYLRRPRPVGAHPTVLAHRRG